MKFEEFLLKQETNYKKFKNNELLKKGFLPTQKVYSQIEGIAVNFKHSLEISRKVEQFSRKISKQVPALVFKKENIHTTIYFEYGKNIQADYILKKFSEILHNFQGKLGTPEIEYKRWLINQNSVIATGFPNEDCFEIINFIYEESKKRNIKFEFFWATHITINRFIEKGMPKKIPQLIKILRKEPTLGQSKIKSINIEKVYFNPKNLILEYILWDKITT